MPKLLTAVVLLVSASLLTAQQALNNDAVVKLLKAGLSEDVIVSTINASPGTYDVSANALIALKASGLSDRLISAIVVKSAGGSPVSAPATAALGGPVLPPGIDEIGVYYKNKSGTWTALLPEVVNFKTGGVLKRFATDGLVKGDINGHVPNAHANTSVTFPVVFAVYVPEGTAITEYQLLRYRTHDTSREFRSMTGGVFHSSGGAERDSIEFHADKVAPRLYQITLDASMGKGEYGLLPPGSYTSSNMASGGKIYSVSIIE
jgi:hypothetical protein